MARWIFQNFFIPGRVVQQYGTKVTRGPWSWHEATFAEMKCENGVVWHAQKNFHQYYFFLVWELEMIIVTILIAMKYIVNGVLQKHMVFFLFYQNFVGQMVGNKALMGIA